MIALTNIIRPSLEAIKLWSPIIERYSAALSNFKDSLSLMCDSMVSNSSGLIAESINLASKLDLKDKNVLVTGSPVFCYLDNFIVNNGSVESYQVRVKKSSEHINENEAYENALIELAANLINSKLENYKSIVIYRLIESISIVEFEDGPYYTLKFRVAFFDEIKVESE